MPAKLPAIDTSASPFLEQHLPAVAKTTRRNLHSHQQGSLSTAYSELLHHSSKKDRKSNTQQASKSGLRTTGKAPLDVNCSPAFDGSVEGNYADDDDQSEADLTVASKVTAGSLNTVNTIRTEQTLATLNTRATASTHALKAVRRNSSEQPASSRRLSQSKSSGSLLLLQQTVRRSSSRISLSPIAISRRSSSTQAHPNSAQAQGSQKSYSRKLMLGESASGADQQTHGRLNNATVNHSAIGNHSATVNHSAVSEADLNLEATMAGETIRKALLIATLDSLVLGEDADADEPSQQDSMQNLQVCYHFASSCSCDPGCA